MKNFKLKLKENLSVFNIICCIILALYVIILFSIMAWGLMNSFKHFDQFAKDKNGFPELAKWAEEGKSVFQNYLTVFEWFKFKEKSSAPTYYIYHMFLFSCLYSIGCSFSIVLSTSLMAYACALFPCKMSKVIYAIVMFAIIFPIIGSLPSEMSVARQFGFYNNFPGNYFLKFSFTNMYFLIIYEAFRGVPKDYKEAAEMDGASMFNIMFNIMYRMIFNILGAVFILQFVTFWNDYNTPMLYLPSFPTLALGLVRIVDSTSGPISQTPVKLAASMVVLIPLLIIFSVFQKYLMGNITAGGIKA